MTTQIDLRSDTVTLPSPEMRAAMAAADLGDDVYGEDPTINALEARAAERLGKAAAVFVPSGTMGNLLAVLSHTSPGDEFICGRSTHTYVAEGAGAARIGGVSTWAIAQERGVLNPEDIHSAVHPATDPHYPHSALLIIEEPHNGWVVPLEAVAAASGAAREHGLAVHMDGARIFNAAVALGVPPAEIAQYADSVMFCFSKGLAAPVGSILVGSEEVIARARRHRKMVGGSMRQAGVLAAAALYALDHMVERLADDHANARKLADGLGHLGWSIDRTEIQTNIFFVEPPDRLDVRRAVDGLESQGVRVSSPYNGRTMRLVTHYGIESDEIDLALEAFSRVSA
jgi:threonine aldolase